MKMDMTEREIRKEVVVFCFEHIHVCHVFCKFLDGVGGNFAVAPSLCD